MFLVLFIVALLVWIFGWAVFHIAGGLIHLALLVGAVFLVMHFVRPRKTTTV